MNVRTAWWAALPALLIGAAACGGGAGRQSGTDPSPTRATAAAFWSAYAEDPDLAALVDLNLACDAATAPRSSSGVVDLSPFTITAVYDWPLARVSDPPNLTVVVGYDDEARASLLTYRWTRLDGSEASDGSGRNDVAVLPGARLVGIAVDPDRHRIYLNDVARFLLLRVDDTDEDGLPDTVAPAPAAAHPTYCGDLQRGYVPVAIAFLRTESAEGIMPLPDSDPILVRPTDEAFRGRAFWRDEDGDGSMDGVTTWVPRSFRRIEANSAFVGASTVTIDADVGARREIWALDPEGTRPVEKLADVLVGRRPESVPLCRALTQGETIALATDDGATILSRTAVLDAPFPKIESVTPDACTLDAGVTTLHVVGRRFRSGITVRLMRAETLVVTGVVIRQDATSLVVDLPNVADASMAHQGTHLEFTNPGAPGTRTVPFFVRGPWSEDARMR